MARPPIPEICPPGEGISFGVRDESALARFGDTKRPDACSVQRVAHDADLLAPERAAFEAAQASLTDAALDLRLVNDRPAQNLSHGFNVLKAMMNLMDTQITAIHALDRFVMRGTQLGGLEVESADRLQQSRSAMAADYERIRVRAIQVLDECEDMPMLRPPSIASQGGRRDEP